MTRETENHNKIRVGVDLEPQIIKDDSRQSTKTTNEVRQIWLLNNMLFRLINFFATLPVFHYSCQVQTIY